MKKEFRVCKNYEFSSIIKKQNVVKSSSFICYFVEKKENHSRIGISVGKKIGNAVHRNKVKRQLRSMIDEVFDFKESYDLIIIVRPVYLKKDYATNLEELKVNKKKMDQKSDKRRKQEVENEKVLTK